MRPWLAPIALSSLVVARAAFAGPPNDPLFLGDGTPLGSQWNLMGTPDPAHPSAGIRGIDAEGAWQTTMGRPDVVIAVLDSGVRYDLPDLADNIALNLGECDAAGVHDIDGDGVLTLAEAATVVGDLDGDGRVTPIDVRMFCENGIDDDGNGYVDDIVGWDFYDNDDDPMDNYGHGTGRAGIAAAVANNGIGIAGVCPKCRILPVRIGRTLLAVPDNLAEAIGYATDRGASATVMATGSIGNSAPLRAAVAYADANGVVQCAAMGNEHSRHHHTPQIYDEVVAVTAVTPADLTNPADYSATWVGSNFGAHAAVAAPTNVLVTELDGSWANEDGTSSSVPHCAGVAGLVLSRARDLGVTPTARQVRSILIDTADDAPGFSPYRGAGRLNAKKAVEAVSATTLPPDARIAAPHFYELFPPGPVPVEIRVANPNVATKLEMGYGASPTSWQPVAGTAVAPTPPAPPQPLKDIVGDANAVTLRMTATDAAGNVTVDRRTFFVAADPDAVSSFPVDLGSSAEGGSVLVDLDGDNRAEIVALTSDGRVHAVDSRGQPMPGFPVDLGPPRSVHPTAAAHAKGGVPTCCTATFSGLAAGDLDGDGRPEIVVTALDGNVYVFDALGKARTGFPKDVGSSIWGAPVLADLDRSGSLSIVVGSYARELHVLDASGAERKGFPVVMRDEAATAAYPALVHSPAVADLDGDGRLEIIVATTESESSMSGELAKGRVYAFHADGTKVSGFPVKPFGLVADTFPVVGDGVGATPIAVDLDGDGHPEIIAGHAAGQLAAFDASGNALFGFDHGGLMATLSPYQPPESDPRYQINPILLAQPVAADLTNDGHPEIVAATMGLPNVDLQMLAANPEQALALLQSLLSVWGADGRLVQPYPVPLEGWTLFNAATIADVDGDGTPEIVASSDGGWVHAFHADGGEANGFPKFTGGWMIAATPVGDLDGDGHLELVATTREGKLFAWHLPGPTCTAGQAAVRWQGLFHDAHNTASTDGDAAPPAVVADAHVAGGAIVFTAVGEDGMAGAATRYDARWSNAPIDDEAAFRAANAVTVSDAPEAGTVVRAGSGIDAGAHVAVVAFDVHGNRSALPAKNAALLSPCGSAGSALHASGGCSCMTAPEPRSRSALFAAATAALAALSRRRRRVRFARMASR